MENLATFRPPSDHGGTSGFSVRARSNDSPHPAQHEQIQLARRPRSSYAYGSDAGGHARTEVLTFARGVQMLLLSAGPRSICLPRGFQ